MSRRVVSETAALALPDLPRDGEGPVFHEPWEAQAFAMALALYDRGVFSWPEWAAALADEFYKELTRGGSGHTVAGRLGSTASS